MRLRTIQIVLWSAALAATAMFVVWKLQAPPASTRVAEAEFRPVFTLPDSEARPRDSAEFRGRYLLVFFGFTNCPDVCPTTLSEVAQVMDDLGAEAARVQPIFISIDPERDRALGLDDYTSAFHPAILGLAGDQAATAAAARSFRVYFEREDDAAAPDGYTMSHSPGLFLVDPDGQWLRQYAYGTPADDILNDLKERF